MPHPSSISKNPKSNDISEEDYATFLKVDEEIEKEDSEESPVGESIGFSDKELSTHLTVSNILGRVGNLIRNARNDELRRKREAQSGVVSGPAKPITWNAQVQSWAETYYETDRTRRNMTRKRSAWFGWKPEGSTSA